MATYRTIRMAFWNNPAIEDMPPEQKLLYLYLFTSPHTNNLGVLSVTVRKIAFETGLDEDDVPPVQHLAQNPHFAPRPAPHRGIRRHPQSHSGTLSPPVRGRVVPFR